MIILLMIGAVAIFIWSQFAPKKPTEKTELLESPLPEPKSFVDVFKENVPKVAAIVGGAGAKLATGGGAVAAVAPAAAIGGTVIGVSALPAATVLPAGLSAMAPTTLTSAVYGTTPAVVGTGTGSSAIGAGAGGSAGSGVLATVGGFGVALAPLVIVPWIANLLSTKKPLTPEQLAWKAEKLEEERAFIKVMTETGSMDYDPKSGFKT